MSYIRKCFCYKSYLLLWSSFWECEVLLISNHEEMKHKLINADVDSEFYLFNNLLIYEIVILPASLSSLTWHPCLSFNQLMALLACSSEIRRMLWDSSVALVIMHYFKCF